MRTRSLVTVVAALGLIGPGALAQSTEYRLDAGGEWDQVSAPEPGSDAALMAEMRRLLADGQASEVRRRMDAWLEENKTSNNPERPQALLLRGNALLVLDREFTSLYDYEDIIRNHPQSAEFVRAIERELDIADLYAAGLKLRSFGIRYADPEPIVREIYIRTGERVPGSELAERALLSLADYYYARRDMPLARDSYDVYLLNFPDGPNAQHARARRIYTDIARFKGPRYDASGLLDAEVRIRNFLARYGQAARDAGIDEGLITRIDESIAAQQLDAAQWYLTQDDWPSARYTLRRLLRSHPESIAAQRAQDMLEARGEEIALLTPEQELEAEQSPETETGGDPDGDEG